MPIKGCASVLTSCTHACVPLNWSEAVHRPQGNLYFDSEPVIVCRFKSTAQSQDHLEALRALVNSAKGDQPVEQFQSICMNCLWSPVISVVLLLRPLLHIAFVYFIGTCVVSALIHFADEGTIAPRRVL